MRIARLLPVVLLAFSPAAFPASPGPEAAAEIDSLLDFIGHSDCVFYRNGSWHDAKTAESHVQDKFVYFSARQEIHTTEDFIALAATKSSFSGLKYKVKCPGTPEQTSAAWLLNELHLERRMRKGMIPHPPDRTQMEAIPPPDR